MNYLEVTVTTTEEMSEAIANLFWELGAGGVVIEDPHAIREYVDRVPEELNGLPEAVLTAEDVEIKGYFPVNREIVDKLADFHNEVEKIKNFFPDSKIFIRQAEVATENWANEWKKYYKPEKIGEKTVIKPSWEDYEKQENELVIELDPGMAFGTGNHPTTSMCINALEKVLSSQDKVLDVGTGSGILAIAAAKLGAKKVLAVDNDPVSTDVAQKNIELNQVKDIVEVRRGDIATQVQGEFQIVIANIIADIVKRLTPQAKLILPPEGYFISSGIIDTKQAEVESVLIANDFLVEEVLREGDWVAIIARKKRNA